MRRRTLRLLACLLLLAVAACGRDDSVSARGDDGAAADPSGDATPTTVAAEQGDGVGTGPITVSGVALADLPSGGDDPAIGAAAPELRGIDLAGDEIEVVPGDDGPMIIAFLAHWCPHCQAELPRIVAVSDDDGAIDGVPVVGVLTGSDPAAGNYPPSAWIEAEGFAGRTLLDSSREDGSLAASAYGLTSYPFLVVVDADGRVAERHAGELDEDGLVDLAARIGDG